MGRHHNTADDLTLEFMSASRCTSTISTPTDVKYLLELELHDEDLANQVQQVQQVQQGQQQQDEEDPQVNFSCQRSPGKTRKRRCGFQQRHEQPPRNRDRDLLAALNQNEHEDLEQQPPEQAQDAPEFPNNSVHEPWCNRNKQFDNVLVHVCSVILGLEFAERISYYGINQGLKNFLGELGWSQVGSNSIKSTWTAVCYLSPMLGAYIADERWGRFRTLNVFGVWYTLGVCVLACSAYPDLVSKHQITANVLCCLGLFAGVAIGTGAIKANVITFGADQFDPNIASQVTQKQRFFSFFYVVINLGAIFSYLYLSVLSVEGSGAIPEEYGYFATFCICTGAMVLAYFFFWAWSARYVHFPPHASALSRVFSMVRGNIEYTFEPSMIFYGLYAFLFSSALNLFAAFCSQWNNLSGYISVFSAGSCVFGMYVWIRYGKNTWYFDKSKRSYGGVYDDAKVDELKRLVRVLPFACFLITWEAVYAQIDANFQSITQQTDLRLTHSTNATGFDDSSQVPGSMLGVFDPITIVCMIPLLDYVLFPWYRRVFGKDPSPYGKVFAGLFLSMFTMFWVAVFEILRRNSGPLTSTGTTGETIYILNSGSHQPMNQISWLAAIPNYVLVALSECLINVTTYDVFYSEVPLHLKSSCQALHLFMVAMGSNASSMFTLLFQSFIPENLNQGNLEYMYYALGVVSFVNVCGYAITMNEMQFGMNGDSKDHNDWRQEAGGASYPSVSSTMSY